jgi:type IV secretory pathway VirB2 component (pilin)
MIGKTMSCKLSNIKTKRSKNSYLLEAAVICVVASQFYLSAIYPANAALAGVICAVLGIVQGALGQAVATMGVLAVCFGAALGKSSWGLAITVSVGISLIFQAAWYAGQFGLGGGCP